MKISVFSMVCHCLNTREDGMIKSAEFEHKRPDDEFMQHKEPK